MLTAGEKKALGALMRAGKTHCSSSEWWIDGRP